MTQVADWETGNLDAEGTRDRILSTFLAAGEAFVSGGSLSEQLQISRTAVWKHIRSLEQMGFQFESVHGTGYRLQRIPDLVLEPLLGPHLRPTAKLGRRIHWFPSLDSTNAVAMKLALQEVAHGSLVTAAEQTGGRGRRGRTWFSPQGGLWLSIILQRPFPLRIAPELTLLASVAVKRALDLEVGVAAKIKWPNDLLLEGKKICGILAEIRADGEQVEHAVVGIGINTNIPAESFPHDIKERASSLQALTGRTVSHIALLSRLMTEFETLFDQLVLGHGFATISDEWRQASHTLGTKVQVQTPAGLVTGLAEQIDDHGALYVRRDNGEVTIIQSGEILF